MTSVLSLNPVEEFHLWLEALVVHYKRTGKPLFANKLIPIDRNYRDELSNSLHVIQDLVESCPKIVDSELGELSHGELGFRLDPRRDVKEQIRRDEVMGKRLGEFLDLWDFMLRYRLLGVSMVRGEEVSRREFKAFGSILADQIANFCRSRAYTFLIKRHHTTKYQHIIHRDIIHEVEIEGSREELERTFLEFFRVLSTVTYFQTQMQRSFKYQKLVILLIYCHFRYTKLLTALDQAHQYLGYCEPQMAEGIQTIKFAIRMEVKRIFGQEFQRIQSERKVDALYSEMEAALGLLKHASQQSFTALVKTLNPAFDEMRLFRYLQRERVDSQQLLKDLNQLYTLATDSETRTTQQGYNRLIEELDQFQAGSMRTLFFKDWKPFEQFSEELKTSEVRERAFILHRFEVFVSTLIGEVSKRSILVRSAAMDGASN